MYLCEICGTCSEPNAPCLRRWGHLGYYHELKVCAKCNSALVSGRNVQQVLRNLRGYGEPPVKPLTQIALPITTRRI